MDKYFVTTPIYYSNATPHIGHAYATTIADALARFHRLKGMEVFFLTGTADHGQKIERKAQEQGISPQELTDENVQKFKDLYSKLEITNDFFIRNSDQENHWPGAQALWNKLVEAGDIYKDSYEGLYCVGCETFKTEKDLDEDGLCSDHNTAPEKVVEENYFFRLSKYTGKVREVIETDTIDIYPKSRKNELLSFIDSGLEDISFSRPKEKVGWAIPVPDDPSHNMYVWCEELSNYITAIGYGRDEKSFKKWWPADVHIVGKDILRFHAIIWPAMLMSAGLPLPKAILSTGLIISGGKKMSKTLGNVISPFEMIERYGEEATRYLLLRHVHPFEDTDVTWERLDEWYTAGLVNGIGNLASRIMKLAEQYLDAPVVRPEPTSFVQEYSDAFNNFEFNHAADYVWKKIQELDERIAEEEPFKVVKEDAERGKEMITGLVEDLYIVGRLLKPFMTHTSDVIKKAVLENKKPENLFPRLS